MSHSESLFFIDLTLVVALDKNACVVLLQDSDGNTLGTGSSKRMPGDEYVPEVGYQLAVARALENHASRVKSVFQNA